MAMLQELLTMMMPILDRAVSDLNDYYYEVCRFVDGIDELSTGKLSYEVIQPDILRKYLATIQEYLVSENTEYELLFPYTYQYYSEPMVRYTNTEHHLLIQVPIFLKPTIQQIMTLYGIDSVPVPYDAETYDGTKNQFTQIELRKVHLAVHDKHYISVSERQLERCWKLRNLYVCQNSFLRVAYNQDTCESALYFGRSIKTIVNKCNSYFYQNRKFEPKIIDINSHLVLSNLPSLGI